MPGVEHRNVTPIIQLIRDICRGRPIVTNLRYADGIAARTQPPPAIPGGPYHKSSKVYYYTRDARRLVQPSKEILSSELLEAGKVDVSNIKLEPVHKLQIADK